MANEFIPKRPLNDGDFTAIKANDRDCLSYAVAFNVPNERAFSLFHPEFLDEQGKLTKVGKSQSKQFFSYAKNREYADAYRETLTEFLNRGVGVNSDMESEEIDGDALARKILSDLAAMVKNGRIQDFEILKIATDILNKYGVLKGSEERVIPPVRVLPERCSTCRLRICVESAVSDGLILDMCAYCKCRKIAEEHGYRFNDGKDLLAIPKEVVDELESKNDVKLLDIINGKIDN